MKTSLLFRSVCLTIACLALTGAALAETVEVRDVEVVVSGVPTGGSIALFSCARDMVKGHTFVRTIAEVLRDDDRDGVIRYPQGAGVPRRSVWVAVDLTTGAIASGAAKSFPLVVSDLRSLELKRDLLGAIANLSFDLPRLTLLIVRPGVGAWLLVSDGDDPGAADGRVSLAFEKAWAVDGRGAAAPKVLLLGDTIVAIDPGHLDVFALQIGR